MALRSGMLQKKWPMPANFNNVKFVYIAISLCETENYGDFKMLPGYTCELDFLSITELMP